MKTLYCVGIFALLAVSVAAKSCRRAKDCDENECCIDRGFFRGGECKPLAKDGEECNEVDAKIHIFSGKYIQFCPCEEGLYCEPEESEEDEGIFKKIFKDFRCTSERRDTVRPTSRPRPTTASEAPVEE